MSPTPKPGADDSVSPMTRASMKWISVLLGGALPVYVLWTLNSLDGALTIDRGTVALLTAAVVTEFGAKWAFAELFREGTPVGNPISRWPAFRAALVGTGVARLIPAGGVVTPVAMAWSAGRQTNGTTAAAFRATALNYGGLVVGAGAGLLLSSLGAAAMPLHGAGVALGAGAMFVGGAIIGASTRIGILIRVVPKRFRPRLERVFVDHRLGRRALLLLTARVLLEAATLAFTLRAFGLVLSAAGVLAAFGLAQVVGGLPGPPGGLGFTEIGLVGILAYMGIAPSASASGVLVFRVISYWMPAAAGVLASISTVRSRRPRDTHGLRADDGRHPDRTEDAMVDITEAA